MIQYQARSPLTRFGKTAKSSCRATRRPERGSTKSWTTSVTSGQSLTTIPIQGIASTVLMQVSQRMTLQNELNEQAQSADAWLLHCSGCFKSGIACCTCYFLFHPNVATIEIFSRLMIQVRGLRCPWTVPRHCSAPCKKIFNLIWHWYYLLLALDTFTCFISRSGHARNVYTRSAFLSAQRRGTFKVKILLEDR